MKNRLLIFVVLMLVFFFGIKFLAKEKQRRYLKKYTVQLYKGYVQDSVYVNDSFGIKYYIPEGYQVVTVNAPHQIFSIQNENSNLFFSVYYKSDYPKLKNHSDFLLFINKEIQIALKKYTDTIKLTPIEEGWLDFGEAHFKYLLYKISTDTSFIVVELAGMRDDIFLNIDLITNNKSDYEELIESLKKSEFKGYIW